MDDRLFINLTPGSTYLDRLTGKTKVRLFFAFVILLIATWDYRIIIPTFVVTLVGIFSLRSKLKSVKAITIFVVIMNLINLFLIWVVTPDYGASVCGGSTVLFHVSARYIVTSETLWYFFVRMCKLMATFVAAMTFIQCTTPSELAAGLYACKIPYKVCMIVSIAFRYIPDILRDYNNIKISIQARGMELDSKKTTLWYRLKQNILILVPLIITSFDRVGNIANAMDLRGFGKKSTRTYYSEHEDGKGDAQMKVFYIALYTFIIYVIVMRIVNSDDFLVYCPWVR